MSGVTFGIYSDEDCTEAVGDLITIENENAVVELNVGTYYVKVVDVPEWYILDESIINVSIVFGETYNLIVVIEEQPVVEEKSGTLVINGDLTTKLSVDGNVSVSGDVSADLIASGTVTYGSHSSGYLRRGATLDSYDISVESGTLTVSSSISESDNQLYTTGNITNPSGVISSIYSDFTIKSSSQNAIYNNGGTFTIESGATVTVSSSYSSGRGICSENGTVNIFGNVISEMTISSGRNIYCSGGYLNIYGNVDLTESGSSARCVYNLNGAVTTIYGTATFTAKGSSGRGWYTSNAPVTVEASGVVTTTGADMSIYNTSNQIVAEGIIYCYGSISNSPGFSGSGVVYLDDDLYYSGS